MTTPAHMQRGKSVKADDTTERARRAVKVFRQMQYGLSAYAKAVTGDRKITVELATGAPRTDGKKIYFQPPIALGDPTQHNRRLCEKRDKQSKLLLCEACRNREEVLINIHHEIAHVAFGSFEATMDSEKREAIQHAINEWGGKYAERIKARFDAAPYYAKNSYQGLATLISPYLPFLVNCLEDARVDAAMIEARKGVRVMLEASTRQIFIEGFTDADGNVERWRDRPLNPQAAIACYLVGAGVTGWDEWLHEEVVKAFTDKTLTDLLGQVRGSKSASETYNLAFPVLARLRELGFFRMPEDEDADEPKQEPEPEEKQEQDEGDSEDQDSDSESGDQDDSEDVPDDDEGTDEGDEEGEGSEPGDDDRPEGEGDEPGESGDSPASSEEGSGEEVEDDDTDDGSEGEPGSDSVPSDADGEDEPSEDEGGAGTADGDSPEPVSDDDAAEQPGDGADGESDEADEDGSGGGDQEQSEGGQEGDGEGDPDSGTEHADDPSSPDADDSDEAEGSGAGSPGSDSDSDGRGDDPEPAEGDLGGGDQAGEGSERGQDSGPEDSSTREPLVKDAAAERIDTGADEGEGGIEVPELNYGEPEHVAAMVEQVHPADIQPANEGESRKEDEAVQVAVMQGLYFEKPSEHIVGVREHIFGKKDDAANAWDHDRLKSYLGATNATEAEYRHAVGIDVDLEIPESIMGPALLATRRVFTDNATAQHQRNLRSGRINKKVLGRRAWNDDDRLFAKKRLPGKRSYAVLIGIDVSGSTIGENLALAKRAAWAQAELCDRAGVDFAVYAHSASRKAGQIGRGPGLHLDIYKIKDFHEAWDSKHQEAFLELGSDSENLDGHTLEFYRKRLDEVNATDKIILYYTDGKMPAANHDEELEILQREIQTCRMKKYTLLGVGIRTNSPIRHGLDTVQVDDDHDLKAVVMHLEKQLLRRAR